MKHIFGIGVLLALLPTALAIEGVPVLHAHASSEPAIYNAECTLARLAAHSTGAPLPVADLTATPLTPGDAPDLALPQVPPSPLLASADPRAPPAAG